MVWNPSYERVIVRKNIGVRELQCPVCKSKMKVTDEDYNLKGNSDIYWCCSNESCMTSCIEEVRYNHSYKEIWHHENGCIVDDWTKTKIYKKVGIRSGKKYITEKSR